MTRNQFINQWAHRQNPARPGFWQAFTANQKGAAVKTKKKSRYWIVTKTHGQSVEETVGPESFVRIEEAIDYARTLNESFQGTACTAEVQTPKGERIAGNALFQ